ncbi:MAG: type II toxin-antitoxin system HicA family toxin [Methanoregula sp.]|nr:type II toxin-antitoxin system HicA family toxin [Methanoregula sp.]
MKAPVISGREMVKILHRKGWIYISQRGSHVKMQHPVSKRQLVIPLHDPLKPGIVHQCIVEAGLMDDDF